MIIAQAKFNMCMHILPQTGQFGSIRNNTAEPFRFWVRGSWIEVVTRLMKRAMDGMDIEENTAESPKRNPRKEIWTHLVDSGHRRSEDALVLSQQWNPLCSDWEEC